MAEQPCTSDTINILDVLSKVANAKASIAGEYILAGVHLLEVRGCKLVRGSGSASGKVFFIADLSVLWSQDNEHGVPVHRVGSVLSYVENLNDEYDQGSGRMKSFVMAMAPNMTEADVNKEDLAEMIGPAQVAKGFRIQCNAWMKAKKTKPSESVTKYRWSYVNSSLPIEGAVAVALKTAKPDVQVDDEEKSKKEEEEFDPMS